MFFHTHDIWRSNIDHMLNSVCYLSNMSHHVGGYWVAWYLIQCFGDKWSGLLRRKVEDSERSRMLGTCAHQKQLAKDVPMFCYSLSHWWGSKRGKEAWFGHALILIPLEKSQLDGDPCDLHYKVVFNSTLSRIRGISFLFPNEKG